MVVDRIRAGIQRKSRSSLYLLSAAVFFMVTTMLFGRAGAANIGSSGSALTTSPVSASLTTVPGRAVTTELQVQNNGTKPLDITMKLEKFKASGDTGQAQIYVPPANDPSLSWVQFSPSTFTAEPGVWKTVRMSIAVPSSAAFGYYYAVLFSPASAANAAPGSNTLRGANAVLVLLNVNVAGEKNVLNVTAFTSDQRVYQYLPATFSVKAHNSGDIFSAPKGDIYISRTENGPVIDTLSINSGQGNVLPGTDRTFTVAWNDGFPVYQYKRLNGQIVSDANGKPITELHWDLTRLTKFRFGRYYARLVFVYNDGSRDIPVHAVVSFWVIPWMILGVFLAIFAILVLGLWTILRLVLKQRLSRHIRLR